MLWFIIALLGYTAMAFVMVMDKFIVSKSVSKPVVYTFFSTSIMAGALLIWPFLDTVFLSGYDWFWAVISGLSFGFGMWGLYTALKSGEASHINPFNGAVVTVGVFVLASFILHEQLWWWQQVGIIFLVIATILLSQEVSKKHHGFHRGFVWAIVSGLFFALSHVTAKYLYDLYPFWTAFMWTRATTSLIAIPLFLYPSVRIALFRKKKQTNNYAKKYAGIIIAFDKIISLVAVILIQYAISIGSVTMVNALVGLQYLIMFAIILFFTKFHPRMFKEYITVHEVRREIIALFLIVTGSIFFIFY